MTKVILFIILLMPGHEPEKDSKEVASVQECHRQLTLLLAAKPPKGGQYQAGCMVMDASGSDT